MKGRGMEQRRRCAVGATGRSRAGGGSPSPLTLAADLRGLQFDGDRLRCYLCGQWARALYLTVQDSRPVCLNCANALLRGEPVKRGEVA